MPESLKTATSKRRDSFVAGRLCAAQAIRSFNPDLSASIGVGRDGAPAWPDGIVGSITHAERFVWAAIGPRARWRGIGIDAVGILSPRDLEPVESVAILQEEGALRSRLSLSTQQFVSLLFSAKESVYKCLYPLVNQVFDFRDVRLVEVGEIDRTFRFRLERSLGSGFSAGFESVGRFVFDADRIYTGVELMV